MSLEQERQVEERQSLAILAGEILQDAQKLFDQQVKLTKLQLFEDWGRAKPFALWLAGGLVALVGASVISAFTLVYLLEELTELPLWACFMIVNLVCLVTAVISLSFARIKLKGLSVLNG
jgi:hypothetical protein